MATDTYIPVGQLAPILQSTLKSLGYHKKDIRVVALTEATIAHHALGDGYRSTVVAVDLETSQTSSMAGSWGGVNPFTVNAVDSDETKRAMVPHVVLIKLQRGSAVFAHLEVHPDQMATMLPKVDELSAEEHAALYCHIGIKGGNYRKEELRYRKVSADTVDSLVERGFLTRNKAGATAATTKGKNALDRSKMTNKY